MFTKGETVWFTGRNGCGWPMPVEATYVKAVATQEEGYAPYHYVRLGGKLRLAQAPIRTTYEGAVAEAVATCKEWVKDLEHYMDALQHTT